MTGAISYAMLNAILLLAQNETDDSNPVWEGWGSLIFIMGIFVIIAAVVIVIFWQIMASRRVSLAARETVARDEAYRALASEATEAQQRLSDQQERLAADLADVKARVNNIERILQEVE